MYHYTECGLGYVWLRNGYEIHPSPYGDAVSIRDVDGLHKVIGLDVVSKSACLTAEEVRFLRVEMDMSQKHLADILGVGETTVRNWESGRGAISGPAERLLRTLFEEHARGNTVVREMAERLAHLSRQEHAERLELEETDDGWKAAA